MNEKPRGSNGRGNRHNNRRNRQKFEPQHQPIAWNPQPCSLCGKVIQEMGSAIAFGTEHLPAHMECVIKNLEERENPGPSEKILYIGAGNFALVREKEGSSMEILRKIPVESKDSLPDWRREIRNQVSKSP